MTSYVSTTGDTWDSIKADEAEVRRKLEAAQENLRQAVQSAFHLSCRLTAWQEEQKSHE